MDIWRPFGLSDFDAFLDTIQKAQVQKDSGFPKVEWRTNENELLLQFALAGYSKNKLSVEVADGIITVKGEKVEDEDNLFAGRAFTWCKKDPQNIWDFNKAEVKYEDGMLTIKAPKKEELKPTLLKIS